jgi:hypothetical protein
MGGQHHALAALPPGKTRYPLYRRLGGPQGRSGRVRKISHHRDFCFVSTYTLFRKDSSTYKRSIETYMIIRSPDRPARSQSLYRLSYPAPPQNGLRQNVSMTELLPEINISCKMCSENYLKILPTAHTV